MKKAIMTLTALAISNTAISNTAVAENDVSILCGSTIDVVNQKRTGPKLIEVSNGRITSVSKATTTSKASIDLSGKTCLPGLIDMHVHLTFQSSPQSYSEGFKLNPADYAFRSVKYAERTLQAGFTTVRNLGDDGTTTKALRNAIAQGYVTGPRIFTAGKSLATTGGHADPTNGVNDELLGDPTAKQGVVNGPIEARKAVRQRYKEGADVIKITATGGVLSAAKSGQNPQFMNDELESIIATAKDYGFKVAAHAHGGEGMIRAIKAGVDSIEHGTLMNDEVRSLMKKNGTYLVPTILAGEFVYQKAQIDGYFPEIVRPKALAIGPQLKENFAKAHKAGVKIAFGTDSGVSAHGDNAKEFSLMVEAGMSPMDAIRSATVHAADLLGESDNLGSLTAGKYADLIAVDENPLDDVTTLENVTFVMKGGRAFAKK